MSFTVNDDYLKSRIGRLLEDENVVLPSFLLKYLYDNFPYKKDELDYLVYMYESDNLLSVYALKFFKGEVSAHKSMERTILLFEIFEFTSEHMEYEDMLLETSVSTE